MFLRFLVERPPVGPLSASVFSLLPLVVYQMMDLLENPFLHQNRGGFSKMEKMQLWSLDAYSRRFRRINRSIRTFFALFLLR